MGSWVDLDDGAGRAWLARPSDGEGPGVLLLHAWWGLKSDDPRRGGPAGRRGVRRGRARHVGGVVVDTVEAAEQEAGRPTRVRRDVRLVRAGAERVVRDRGEIGRGIGVVGFSFGAAYALELVADPPPDEAIDAVVLAYGTGAEHDWTETDAAFQGHFAANDPFESAEGVDALESALRSAGRHVEFHRYPGVGHWFMEPDREDAYNGDAADLAFGRIVAFLRENLGPLGA